LARFDSIKMQYEAVPSGPSVQPFGEIAEISQEDKDENVQVNVELNEFAFSAPVHSVPIQAIIDEREEQKAQPESRQHVVTNAHSVVLENEISLLHRKMSLLNAENRQLREALRQTKLRASKVEDSVACLQVKDGYQL